MKRGLKASPSSEAAVWGECYNLFPDEKGTERPSQFGWVTLFRCYNLFPDEKGTESQHMKTRVTLHRRYNLFPDEKGTESIYEDIKSDLFDSLQPIPR